MLHREIEGLFWPSGESPTSCRMKLFNDGSVKLSDSNFDGLANLYGILQDRYYAIGEYVFHFGSGQRPEYLEFNESSIGGAIRKIEPSALNRLRTILQRDSGISIDLRISRTTVSATIKALQQATAGSFFACELTEARLFAEREVIVVVYVLGMAYSFKAFVLDRTGNELAMSLPTHATRFLRRFTPRINGSWEVHLGETLETKARLVNFSPLGICVELPEGMKVERWDELKLLLCNENSSKVNTYGLVMAVSEQRIHLLLSGTPQDMKTRYYMLGYKQYEPFLFREDPEKSWECLERFKYLELMEGRVLASIKSDCLTAWHELKESDASFQPVAYYKNEPVGTIGAIQAATDHWVPHALSTKVDPSLIDVSSALYMSWPNYLLSLARPLWMSTWYDANKPWHNRFYHVFIKEHEDNQNVVSFVRQYYLAPVLQSFPGQKIQLILSRLVAQPKERATPTDGITSWQERWGVMGKAPVLKLESKEGSIFSHSFGEIREDGKCVGMFKLVTSPKEVNPFCVLQAIHLNVFDEAVRSQPEWIDEMVKSASSFLLNMGLKRAAITLDFDLTVSDPKAIGVAYFGEMRCLATVSPLLPALTSNNALSFADMKARSQPT